jgi:HSP20 family molecular chaperone IbpA
VEPDESRSAVCRETHAGDDQRQFTLTEDVGPNSVTAQMKSRVLTVGMGKPEGPKAIRTTAGN